MRDPQYLGQALTLTGPESLTYAEVAKRMTTVLNEPISYSKPSLLHFRHVMIKRGIKKEFVNVMVMLYVITRLGNAKATTNTLQNVLGRAPITIDDFTRDEVVPYLQ